MNGKILQVIGPVVDVYFKDQLPLFQKPKSLFS